MVKKSHSPPGPGAACGIGHPRRRAMFNRPRPCSTTGRQGVWPARLILLLVWLAWAGAHAGPPAAVPPGAGFEDLPVAVDARSSAGSGLGAFLDENGYLDLPEGFSGSLDPSGFELLSQAGERPRFAAKAGGDARWADGFGLRQGCNGGIYAAAVGAAGELYLAGGFTACSDTPANRIVRYDPQTGAWSALGSGGGNGVSGGDVVALAVIGADLYVGGDFTQANAGDSPLPANRIARWDGLNWSALGSAGGNGVSGTVSALVVLGSDLYAGGWFAEANVGAPVPANRIARWDTLLDTWSALGSGGGNGVNSGVRALAVGSGNLYVGGHFTAVNVGADIAANRIARWSPITLTWSAMGLGGGGLNGPVFALAPSGSSVYVGGRFTQANVGASPIAASNLARWTGLAWAAVGSGGGNGVDGEVTDLAVVGSDLLVAGRFDNVNLGAALAAPGIARWSGSTWSTLGSAGGNGVDGWVRALAVDGSDLFVGGIFAEVNAGAPVVASNIARWDGAAWTALDAVAGSGVSGEVYAVAISGPDVYVGGWFTGVGDLAANNLAHWNGSAWSALGSGGGNGVACCVYALAVSGSDLYVGGLFAEANLGGVPVPANSIVRWDGTVFSALGSGGGNGLNCCVFALAVSGNTLFAAGNFNTANLGGVQVTANKLARWDGSAWTALGSNGGNGVSGEVRALLLSGNDLYVGGYFGQANVGASPQVSASRIARWDGAAWSALGSDGGVGVDGAVHALTAMGGDLYVGGDFSQANFPAPSPTPANRIARWDGVTWSALGSNGGNGVDGRVRTLIATATGLYAGGDFTQANVGDALVARHVAHWNGSAWSSLGSGVSSSVYHAAMAGTSLYVGGVFAEAGGKPSSNIARFTPSDLIHVDGFEDP
jgi:hypothetical protein